MTTLILIPVRPDLHPALQDRALTLASSLEGQTEIVMDMRPWPVEVTWEWERRIIASCALRQALIDDHLAAQHDAVLWVDADIIRYPADLLTRLATLAPLGVAAPAVLLDRCGPRWYDIAGFVEDDRWARMAPPYFSQRGPVVELESVGCVYRVSADIYRAGARHTWLGKHSDHYSVCAFARELGRRVCCDLTMTATHAYLPDYDEALH
jgi:hypothetical protein